MIIDTHHHFWKYNLEEFGWIPEAWKNIQRDFLPSDLEGEIRDAGVDGVISVQARQSLEETRWLLELAKENDFIQGVVGWVPLASPACETNWIVSWKIENSAAFAMSSKVKVIPNSCSGPHSKTESGR
jgi:L-fuconolactonase